MNHWKFVTFHIFFSLLSIQAEYNKVDETFFVSELMNHIFDKCKPNEKTMCAIFYVLAFKVLLIINYCNIHILWKLKYLNIANKY